MRAKFVIPALVTLISVLWGANTAQTPVTLQPENSTVVTCAKAKLRDKTDSPNEVVLPCGKAQTASPTPGATPEPPRVFLDTTYLQPTGRTIMVSAGGDLQAAIDQAKPGDIISLQAGATFTGNFKLPNKNGKRWIIIRSSTSDANLPRQGTRAGPQHAGQMAKIITPNAESALRTEPGAHHYRLLGVEIAVAPQVLLNYGIVLLGDSAHNSFTQLPHDLILDRCYIHGNAVGDVSRGIALNSAATAVIDSSVMEIHGNGFDTQAICGWNGSGPFKIVNNYLEGAGENIMFGGADPKISNLIPSDIEFRRNYLAKPLSWKPDDPAYAGKHWSVKNLFELKNAQRVLIDGNTFENNWVDAQSGFAILLGPRNQDGQSSWSVVQDVSFTNNIVRHSAAGLNIFGRDDLHPSQRTARVAVLNNLFDDIGGWQWGYNGRFFQITDAANVTLDHNTANQTGNIITAYGAPSPGFVFTYNKVNHNESGVIGDSCAPGLPTLNQYMPGFVFTGNALIGGEAAIYPPGNYFPQTASDAPASSGADLNAISAAQA